MLGGTFPTGFSKTQFWDTILHCQHYHSIVSMENLTFLFLSYHNHHNTPLKKKELSLWKLLQEIYRCDRRDTKM